MMIYAVRTGFEPVEANKHLNSLAESPYRPLRHLTKNDSIGMDEIIHWRELDRFEVYNHSLL